MSRISGYGFVLRKATTLSGIADREGTRQRSGTRFRYTATLYGSDKVFYVLTESLTGHGAEVKAERIKRNAEDTEWVRSGEPEVTLTDLFQNTDDETDIGTIVTAVPYEGREVIDAIYCRINDWLDD